MNSSPLLQTIQTLASQHEISFESNLQRNSRISIAVPPKRWKFFLELLHTENQLRFSKLHCLLASPLNAYWLIVAELSSSIWKSDQWLSIRTKITENETLPSITSIWPYANWFQAEIASFYPISFESEDNIRDSPFISLQVDL